MGVSTMSKLHTHHGYLDRNLNISMISPDRQRYVRPVGFAPTRASDLWGVAQQYGVTHLWLENGSVPEYMGYELYEEEAGWYTFVPMRGEAGRPERPHSALIHPKDERGKPLFIGYPQHDVPWDFWEITHPLDCLATIDYLEQCLKVPVQWSCPRIGRDYLNTLYQSTAREKSFLREPTVDLKALPFVRASKDLRWKARIDPEMIGGYLHVYDQNASQPNAAGYMVTGIGDPEHVDAAECEFPLKTGIYRVEVDYAHSIFNGKQLPLALETDWVTGVQANFARRMGYHVQVQEGWMFPERRVLFEEWVHDLWSVRQLLGDRTAFVHEVGRKNAQDTIKRIMNFSMHGLRLNWYTDMISGSVVSVLACVKKHADKGHFPCMIYFDEIGYASKNPDPRTAVPGMLDRERELGGFKYKYTVPITKQLISDCNEIPVSKSGTMQKYIKRLAEREVVRHAN